MKRKVPGHDVQRLTSNMGFKQVTSKMGKGG